MIELPKTLKAPALPISLSGDAKWLAGEGAGSWFVIEKGRLPHIFNVSRFSPGGLLECSAEFNSATEINVNAAFEITYPAHCAKITILQGNKKITVNRTSF